MQQIPRRYLSLIAILVLGLATVGFIAYKGYQQRSLWSDQGYHFLVDIDNWRGTEKARLVSTPYDFTSGRLSKIPLKVGNWVGKTVPQTNKEVFLLLEPDEFVQRRYCNGDTCLWLVMIGSHKARSFHPPDICYKAANWGVSVGSGQIRLRSGDLWALKVRATKAGHEQIVLYFFIWPNEDRTGSPTTLFDVTVNAKPGEEAKAIETAKSFIREFFVASRKVR
jgi:hypothetical protein